jgi:hypothetical protein
VPSEPVEASEAVTQVSPRRARALDRREIQELDIAEPPTVGLGRPVPPVPQDPSDASEADTMRQAPSGHSARPRHDG